MQACFGFRIGFWLRLLYLLDSAIYALSRAFFTFRNDDLEVAGLFWLRWNDGGVASLFWLHRTDGG